MSKIGKNTLFSLLANHRNLRENSRRLHLHAVSLFDQAESLIGRLCCFLPHDLVSRHSVCGTETKVDKFLFPFVFCRNKLG